MSESPAPFTFRVRAGGIALAQIKSTLDLILEKTKHLHLTDQEKEALKQEESVEQVRRHLLPFLKEEREIHFLSQWLEQVPKDRREEALRISAGILIESLSPFEENKRILIGVEKLFGKEAHAKWKSLLDVSRSEFVDLRRTALTRAESQFRELLASEGIRGRAVVPCVEQTAVWLEEEKKLLDRFRAVFQAGLGSQFPHR